MKYSADLKGNEDYLYVLIWNNVQDVFSGKSKVQNSVYVCVCVCVCCKKKTLKNGNIADEWEE